MLLLIKVSWWSDWRSMFFSFYNKHFLLFPLLCAIFPSIMRVLSSLSETEDWTTLSRYRSTTFASDRIVIYRVCTRERPYLRAYVVPAGCRYRDMGKLKFYDDTANGMCPLLGTYVPGTGDTLIPSLEFVSWHWFLSFNFLVRPCLHCTYKRNGYRILLRTRHLHEHFSPDFWCALVDSRKVSSRFDFAKKMFFDREMLSNDIVSNQCRGSSQCLKYTLGTFIIHQVISIRYKQNSYFLLI